MTSQQILPVNNTPQASGQGQKANGIVQTQQPQQSGAWVLCDNGTVYINGSVEFSPPQPIADASKIFSPDLSSQVQCINGGQITVLGQIQGYSTTAQTNQAIGNATADFVTQQFLEDNYYDITETQNYVGNQISALSSVFMPIDQTLDGIPLAENTVDLNQQKIENLANPVDLQDAVNLQYLQNNYTDTTQSQSFVNNAIGDLSSVYQSINTTLDAIPLAENNMNFNGQKLQNIGFNADATDAVRQDYLTTYYLTSGDIANIYQPISEMVNYVQTSFLTSNYTNNTVLQSTYALISSLQNYVLSSTLVQELSSYTTLDFLNQNFYTQNESQQIFATQQQISDFVTQTELTDNYYTQGQINGSFALISSLSNYVLTSTLNTVLSAYVTSAQLAIDLQAYATEAYVQAYTYSRSYIDSNFALISSLSSYVTNNGLVQILSDYATNGFLTTNYTDNSLLQQLYATKALLTASLSNYIPTANIGQYTTSIQTNTSGTKSKVDASTSSQILFNINDVQKLRMYVPAGQSTQPCGLIADDKIQMLSGENSFSLTGQKALQAKPTQNFSGLYISGLDNAALNVGQQIQIGSQFCQKLALASGHTDIGGGTQVLYSTISNSAEGVAQQNLQISGGTPQTDNTLVLYSDSYATALGQNLSAQFTKKTGYSATTSITEANQFSSKAYVDSAISGLSSVYQTISGMSSYYTKTAVDNLISGLSSVYLSISSFNSQIANYYTKPESDGLFALISSIYTQAQSDARFYLNTVTLNNITAPTGNLGLNNNRITGLADGIAATDAATVQQISAVSGALTGSITMWPTVSAPSGYLICDGSTYDQATYPQLFAVLGSTTLPDFRDKFARGYSSTSGRTILDVQQDAYENHLHAVTSSTFTTGSGGSHTHSVDTRAAAGSTGGVAFGSSGSQGSYSVSGGAHAHTIVVPAKDTNLSTTGSTETRPINICLNFIIKT